MRKHAGSLPIAKDVTASHLFFFGIGFHRALATIDSVTGLLTLVTGTSHAIGIGVHHYPFGRAMTCKRHVVDYVHNSI